MQSMFLRVTFYDLIDQFASRMQGQMTKLSKNPYNLRQCRGRAILSLSGEPEGSEVYRLFQPFALPQKYQSRNCQHDDVVDDECGHAFEGERVDPVHQQDGQYDVCQVGSHAIRNRIKALARQVARGGNGEVTDQRGPATTHISGDRNEHVVGDDCNRRPSQGNDRTVVGPVRKLEPHRQVIVNAKKKIRGKQDRHDGQPFPVGLAAKEDFQYVEVDTDRKEEYATRHDEVMIDHRKQVPRVLFACIAEKERLRSETERLDHEVHEHGELVVRAKYPQCV